MNTRKKGAFESLSSRNGGAFDVKILSRLQRVWVGRLFKINHVFLSEQALSPLLFFLLILFEFLQIAYFTFYKVELINEFSKTIVQADSESLMQMMKNISFVSANESS